MTDDGDGGYIAAYEQARKAPMPPWDELPLPWREMIIHIWFAARKSAASK
jgi:hypothetical protein